MFKVLGIQPVSVISCSLKYNRGRLIIMKVFHYLWLCRLCSRFTHCWRFGRVVVLCIIVLRLTGIGYLSSGRFYIGLDPVNSARVFESAIALVLSKLLRSLPNSLMTLFGMSNRFLFFSILIWTMDRHAFLTLAM